MWVKEKAYIYSLDENITPTQLKENNFDSTNYNFSYLENWMKKEDIGFFVQEKKSKYFNSKFLNIVSSPYIVYYKWDSSLLDKNIIWIVWPRKYTSYAWKVIDELFEYLQHYDVVTVSWLAEWVDELVYEKSISYWIPTIAVLWGWLWYFLSSRKKEKLNKIYNNWWLILSEFRLKLKPAKYTFPQRNRIIAWLSDVLFLPEAGENSGSLITVDYANKMSIDVYATAGRLFDENSKGVNYYIKTWNINLVDNIQRFLDNNFSFKNEDNDYWKVDTWDLSDDEKDLVLAFDGYTELNLEDISRILEKDVDEILTTISILEMKWKIFQSSPGRYSLGK